MRTLCPLLMTTAALLIAGCDQTDGETSLVDPAVVSLDELEDEPTASTDDALADQLQSDIDDFIARQNTPPRPAVTPVEEMASTDDATTRVEIEWSDPPAPSDPAPAEDVAAAPEGHAPAPLPTPESSIEVQPAPTAVAAGEEARVDELIVDLSGALWREAAYADMPLRELLLVAATSIVRPDRSIDAEAIPGLTERERELLEQFQAFFVELGRELDGSIDPEVVIDSALTDLRDMLEQEPDFVVPTAQLCTRVGGFGDVDAFGTNDDGRCVFLAHSDQQAIVYIELDGFESEVADDGQWVTEISQRLVIYADHTGIPVWREDWQTVVDRSTTQRNDFFTVQVITLPKQLGIGRYHVKVQVRDEHTGAETETGIGFEMVADEKMVSAP